MEDSTSAGRRWGDSDGSHQSEMESGMAVCLNTRRPVFVYSWGPAQSMLGAIASGALHDSSHEMSRDSRKPGLARPFPDLISIAQINDNRLSVTSRSLTLHCGGATDGANSQVLRKLAKVLEVCQQGIKEPPSAEDHTSFVSEGGARSVLLIKLTVPQEGGMEAAFEQECVTLADDIGYMACKFFPVSRIATECLEEENVEKNEDILKADNCRRTLEHLFKMMKANWAEFNLATHGLGPYVLKTTRSKLTSWSRNIFGGSSRILIVGLHVGLAVSLSVQVCA
ncbi:unnamed protein product [Boreogadus saida]